MLRSFHMPVTLLIVLLVNSIFANGSGLASPAAGQKYLLAVGINNYREKPLRGAVNDAVGIRETLISRFGFAPGDTTLLTDSSATRAGIIGSIVRYSNVVERGDLFVFFYSGHGTLFADSSSSLRDEEAILDLSSMRAQGSVMQDGRYDSTIVPFDIDNPNSDRPWGNLILDDELNELFSRMTAKGAFVLLLSDSCHSGTLARSIAIDERYKFIDPGKVLGGRSPQPTAGGYGRPLPKNSFNGLLLAITSSKDNQYSVDGRFDGRLQGMFTHVLLRVISNSDPLITYQRLFGQVQREVSEMSSGAQTPSIDQRYFDGGLDNPVFSVGSESSSSLSSTRVRVVLLSRNGETIPGGSIALFPSGQRTLPDRITGTNTLAVVKTKENGEALTIVSDSLNGDYLVKALADGFEVFTGQVRVRNVRGQATVVIVLDPLPQ